MHEQLEDILLELGKAKTLRPDEKKHMLTNLQLQLDKLPVSAPKHRMIRLREDILRVSNFVIFIAAAIGLILISMPNFVTTSTKPVKNLNLTPHIVAPNFAQPGSTIKITGKLPTMSIKGQQMTIELFRNKMPNSGLNFEASLHSGGTFSSFIRIPSNLPYGDYQLLFFNSSTGTSKPFLKNIYILPSINKVQPPKNLPVLNIWATPPLLGTMVMLDGWVHKGTNSLILDISGKVQHTLQVQSNGHFEGEILLPYTLKGGKTQFVIKGINNKVLLKKVVLVGTK